jgi:hypothetical protein
MGSDKFWLLLAVTLPLLGCDDRGGATKVPEPAAAWTLSVASPVNVAPVVTLWIGLLNPGASGELLCLQSVEVTARGSTGDTSIGTPTSPHSGCGNSSNLLLVRGGEGHFIGFDVSTSPIPPDNRIRVQVNFSNREGSRESLTWEGTVAETQSTMRQLLAGAQGPR